jgi:glutamine synthetase
MLDTITGRLSNSGHEALVGLEIEFYLIPASLIRDSRSRHYSPSSIPRAQYGSINNVVIEELADAAERCEISVDSVHREYENLQYEFALGPTDPLRAADNALIFREMARSVARKHGAWACFMPKPFTDEFGSGMHINISVDSGVPARGDVAQLSPTVANLQSVAAHFPACCAIWNPTVNSYRRLRGADFSNISLPVGEERRDTFLRIADSAATNHKRMEFRLPDAVSNPYTSIAVCLSLLSADTSGDQAPMAEEVRLPNSLAEAMQAFKRDRVVRKVFSHEFAAVLLAQQAEEVRHYDSAVSDVDYMLHMPELYLDGTG